MPAATPKTKPHLPIPPGRRAPFGAQRTLDRHRHDAAPLPTTIHHQSQSFLTFETHTELKKLFASLSHSKPTKRHCSSKVCRHITKIKNEYYHYLFTSSLIYNIQRHIGNKDLTHNFFWSFLHFIEN